MILTCPECASRYFVDDARVGPQGRTVRCASCAHTWRALPEGVEAPLSLSPAPEPEPERPAPLPERLRAEAQEKRRTRETFVAGVAIAAVGVVFVGMAVGAVLFRADVVRLWPKTASVYAFAHLPVNPTGLALDAQGQANLVAGHPAFTVTGVERNIETEPKAPLPLRVTLYDKAGHVLRRQVSTPPSAVLPPGASRPFAVDFIDPPHELSGAVVEFAFDAAPPAERAKPAPPKRLVSPSQRRADAAPGAATATPGLASAAQPPPQVSPQGPLHGPAPGPVAAPVVAPVRAKDAKPLPSDSPYALPPAAIQQTSH